MNWWTRFLHWVWGITDSTTVTSGDAEESLSNWSEYSSSGPVTSLCVVSTHNEQQKFSRLKRIAMAKQMYQFDWPVPDIAAELGVHPDTVYKYLRA